MIDVDAKDLAKLVKSALQRATRIHDELGAAGLREVRLSPVGEMSLECDIRCEKAVLDALREAGLSGMAYTEEHGVVKLGDGAGLTIALDGLDGTYRYKMGPGQERYATMVTVLRGDDPAYGDYLVCATKEHATGRLFWCTKGGGAWLEEAGRTTRLQVAEARDLGDVTLTYLDQYWLTNQRFYQQGLPGRKMVNLRASCIYYEDLARGLAQLVLECTRKRNLELVCGYGLVREAGGVTVTPEGASLGGRRYRSFAQLSEDGDVHIPVITACSSDLAARALGQIRRQLPAAEWDDLTAGRRER